MLEVEELEALKALSPQAKLTFYWSFSHQLTILSRALWSQEALAPAQRLEGMKWVNEIMHRSLNRMADLLFQHDLFDEEGTWQLISHYLSQSPALEPAIKQAFNHSLAFAPQKTFPVPG